MRKVPTARLPGAQSKAKHNALYNRYQRDKEATSFYHLAAWLAVRQIKLCQDPYCEECLTRGIYTPATTCHHKIERSERPDLCSTSTTSPRVSPRVTPGSMPDVEGIGPHEWVH